SGFGVRESTVASRQPKAPTPERRLPAPGSSGTKQPPDPPEDFRESRSRVVIHHDREQQRDRQQAEPQDVLASLNAERTSLGRLEDVDQDLAAVENGDRKQIEHGDVDAQQRNQIKKLVDAVSRC